MTDDPLRVGVVGVGSMGGHHARIYAQLPGVDLVGVADEDWDRASEVAEEYGTRPLNRAALLRAVEAASVAVPTPVHATVVEEALDAGTNVLVEKPFVDDPETGHDLIERADGRDLRLQVGHVERFNPAVTTLADVVSDLEVLAVDARRLGPPVDRQNGDSVVRDLMIHDLDVLCSLFDDDVTVAGVSATATPDEPHVTATLDLSNGVVGTLTASRITNRKVRELTVTARECHVTVDYLTQSVRIHRQSLPAYVEDEGEVRYRSESVVEVPQVESGEPLRRELDSFVDAVRTGTEPAVTGEDGLRAIDLCRRVSEAVEGPLAAVAGGQP